MDLRQIWRLAVRAYQAWRDDYAPSMGAALSYYALFSIAPLLLIVIGVAGFFFGEEAARGEIFGQLNALIGAEGARAVEGLIASARKPQSGLIAMIAGTGLLIVGASTVFGELQNALDRIWRAPAREYTKGWWKLIRTRVLSFGMILGIAFLLMVSLVLSAAVSAIGRWWGLHLVGSALRHRQVGDRALYREKQRRLRLRRRRLACGADGVGVLLGADFSARRRIHAAVRGGAWFAQRNEAARDRSHPRAARGKFAGGGAGAPGGGARQAGRGACSGCRCEYWPRFLEAPVK